MSVLGSVVGAENHWETSQAPSHLPSWVDRMLPLPFLTHLQWVAGAAVAAASAQAWEATPLRAHQALLSPADGESRSGGVVAEGVSSFVGTHSG